MRDAEMKRRNEMRVYARYKNKWFIDLIVEATKREYWVKYDIARMKNLRKIIESQYKIDICYFSAFIYFSVYKFLRWNKRSLEYSNLLGFMINENNLVDFANYLGKKNRRSRMKVSRWPEEYEQRWGLKSAIETIKIGKYDQHVETHLMSKKMDKEFKKYLGE